MSHDILRTLGMFRNLLRHISETTIPRNDTVPKLQSLKLFSENAF